MTKTGRSRQTLVFVVFIAVLAAAAYYGYPKLREYLTPPEAEDHNPGSQLYQLTGPESLKLKPEAVEAIGLKTKPVEPASAPDPLRLPGYLLIDPNGLVPVHSLFPGRVERIGTTEVVDIDGKTKTRRVRYGDTVKMGQLLAVVWSTDVGQKKSDLVDALSRLALDEKIYAKLKEAGPSVVPARQIAEAERAVEADKIAANSARRTLLSWKLSEVEIEQVEKEALQLKRKELQNAAAKTWPQIEIVAPMDGVIVEKSVNDGEIVDTNDALFKVADLSRIQVLAYLFEEDLPLIEKLTPRERVWQVDLKSDPVDKPRSGTFELVGSVIDQTLRTAPIIGWLDNPIVGGPAGNDRQFRANQFVTATIALPPDPGMVSVPTSALIEEGSTAAVFVETDPTAHVVTRRVVAVTRRGEKSVFIRAQPSDEERRQGAEALDVGELVVLSGGLELDSELNNLKSAGANERGDE
ncbi:MAG TPA: efflux RND transporter periplasmic adaptor subunit [Pirellulales bacterium]|nr:efflux RND transporter periplasmic adaptor subunit [Pirellulales bacterium]